MQQDLSALQLFEVSDRPEPDAGGHRSTGWLPDIRNRRLMPPDVYRKATEPAVPALGSSVSAVFLTSAAEAFDLLRIAQARAGSRATSCSQAIQAN